MHGFHDSGLEKEWWWMVWRDGFGDSSPEKQAIHSKGVSFRESSLENGMLPYLGRCFHDSSPAKFGSWTKGCMVFMTRVLKRLVGGWFGKEVFVTPVPKNKPSNQEGVFSGVES